jgi:hypothetical protein
MLKEKQAIVNLANLGLNSVIDGNRKKLYQIPRKERISECTYQVNLIIHTAQTHTTPVDLVVSLLKSKKKKKHIHIFLNFYKIYIFAHVFLRNEYELWDRSERTAVRQAKF